MQTDGHFFANKILFYLLDGHQDVFVLAQNGLSAASTFHFSVSAFHFSVFTFHFSAFTFHFSVSAFHLSLFTFQLSLFISFISTILTNTGNIP